MKARHAVLVAVAAAVTLTSVAAAGPEAARQRVTITTTILPTGKAVLIPLQPGQLEVDKGRFGGNWASIPGRTVMRDGQSVDIHTGTWTLTGKLGTLWFRERNEWVDVGSDVNNDGFRDGIAVGTWNLVRGTGQYAGITGGGRSAHSGLGNKWFARYEGFLTRK